MALTRQQKQEIIKDLREKISHQKIMVFVDFKSLKTRNLSELRKILKKNDCQVQILKKTLLQLALKEENVELDTKKLEGQVAVVFGFKNKILSAKAVYNFSLEFEALKILGGFFDNEFRDSEEIITLAKLPTREELLAGLIGTLSAPMSNFVNVLQGNIRDLVFVLSAIKK